MNLLTYIKKYRNSSGLFLATVISAICSVLLSITLARILTVEERGTLQFILTNIVVISTISTGGVGYALGISIKNNEYSGWVKIVFSYLTYTLFITSILCYFALTNIHPYSDIFIVCVILYSLTLITIEKSNIDQQLTAYKCLTILQPLVNLILFGCSYLIYRKINLEKGLIYLSISYLILSIFSLFFLKRLSDKHKKIQSKIKLSSFFKIWIKQYIFQGIGVLTINLDKYLIAFFLNDYILGIYSVYLALDGLIGRFFQSAANYHYSSIWNKKDKTKTLLPILIFLCFISLIIIKIFGNSTINFLFGSQYSSINEVLILLTLSSMISGFSWILSQNMLFIGKQIPLIIRQFFSVLVFTISVYILKDLQLFGIAISLIIASTIRLSFSIYYIYRYPIKNWISNEKIC